MGKKKLLLEIESLKKSNETLREQKKELIDKQFEDDIKLVVDTLSKHGNLDWEINAERLSGCMWGRVNKVYTFRLHF